VKAKELQELTRQELEDKLNGLYKQFMELQFKKRSGIEKPHLFKQTKHDIARVLTILNKKKGAEGGKR